MSTAIKSEDHEDVENSNNSSKEKQQQEGPSSSKPTEKKFDLEDVLRKEIVAIKTYPTEQPALVIQDWKKVQRSINSYTISEETLYLLVSMACHLADPEDGHPFMAEPYPNSNLISWREGGTGTSISGHTDYSHSSSLEVTQVVRKEDSGGDEDQMDQDNQPNSGAKAACYLSATLMRLITKPAENYKRSLNHIKKTFFGFYITSSSIIESFNPSIAQLKAIKNRLSTCHSIRNSFVNHLAYAETRYQLDHLKRLQLLVFVAVQHLEFTGMKIYPMFLDLARGSKILNPGLLLAWLSTPDTKDCCLEIWRVLTQFHSPAGNPQGSPPSRFWKYARVIDSGYFLKLQPKSNKMTTAILAKLCYRKGLVGKGAGPNADPRNMFALANEDQIKLDAAKFADDFDIDYDLFSLESAGCGIVTRIRVEKRLAARGVKRAPEEGEPTRPRQKIARRWRSTKGKTADPGVESVSAPAQEETDSLDTNQV